MFRPPTDGYEEACAGDLLHDHLIRKPSSTLLWPVKEAFVRMTLDVGDLLVVEADRKQQDACLALVDHESDRFLCQLFWSERRRKWFAVTDKRSGRLTEDMVLVGVATYIIKNQLRDEL